MGKKIGAIAVALIRKSILELLLILGLIVANSVDVKASVSSYQYYIIEVDGYQSSNSAVINEIAGYDSANNNKFYGVVPFAAYDTGNKGSPSYWVSSVWCASNLTDRDTSYSENSSTLFLYPGSNSSRARFVFNLGSSVSLTKFSLWTGGSLGRNPYSVLIYGTNSYAASQVNSFDNTNLTLLGTINPTNNLQSTEYDVLVGNSVPGAVSGLSVNGLGGSVTLTWNANPASDNVTSYNIYLDGSKVGNVTGTSYNFSGLVDGSHTFGVTAVNTSGESSVSSVSYVVQNLPAVPTGLKAANVTVDSVDLSWSAVTGATSYNIYQNGNLIATTTGTAYSATDLTPTTTYSFQVTAVNSTGESQLSNALDVTTSDLPPAPPAIPTGLSAGNITTTSFTVYWLKVSGADSYNVYLDGNLVGNVSQTIIFNPSYDFTGLSFGSTHIVTITAVNQYGESPSSQPLSVTTTVPHPILQVRIDNHNINLSWSSAQGVTADKYLVMVNGSQVASITAKQYTVTEKPGTYQLQVIEVDTTGSQYYSNVVTVTVSALSTVGAATMTGELVKNISTVMVPMGALLALALAIKGSPLLISAVKTSLLSKWFR